MTAFALSLVVAAAVLHATWNLLAKRVAGGLPFVFLVTTVSPIVYAPLALGYAWWVRPEFGWGQLGGVLVSSVVHIAYFTTLQRGYRNGDLSVVYPVARSTGPLLSVSGAILFFNERPSPLGLVGIAAILGGVLLVAADSRRHATGGNGTGLSFGLATGGLIALYTLWDAYVVLNLGVPPLLFDWSSNVGRSLLLLPLVPSMRSEVASEWRRFHREIVVIAIISTLGYLFVLTALTLAPVSYVAPARELSIVFATAGGAWILRERVGRVRILAAIAMVAGLIVMGLAGG